MSILFNSEYDDFSVLKLQDTEPLTSHNNKNHHHTNISTKKTKTQKGKCKNKQPISQSEDTIFFFSSIFSVSNQIPSIFSMQFPEMGLLRSVLALCLGFVVVCLVVVPPAVAKFVVEKNSLTVVSPESIKGTHDSAIGNFGIPQYGGSMAGTVVYPKENTKGCKGFDEYGISFKSKIGALPTFVVVDRGGTHVSYWTNLLVFGVFRFLMVCFD